MPFQRGPARSPRRHFRNATVLKKGFLKYEHQSPIPFKREHSGCARNTFESINAARRAAGVALGKSAGCKYVIYVCMNFRPSQFYRWIEIHQERRSPTVCRMDHRVHRDELLVSACWYSQLPLNTPPGFLTLGRHILGFSVQCGSREAFFRRRGCSELTKEPERRWEGP